VCSRGGKVANGGKQMVNLTTSHKNKKNQVNQKEKMFAKLAIKKDSKCFSCKEKKGHMKKDFLKFKNLLEKKDNYLALFVTNLM